MSSCKILLSWIKKKKKNNSQGNILQIISPEVLFSMLISFSEIQLHFEIGYVPQNKDCEGSKWIFSLLSNQITELIDSSAVTEWSPSNKISSARGETNQL